MSCGRDKEETIVIKAVRLCHPSIELLLEPVRKWACRSTWMRCFGCSWVWLITIVAVAIVFT
jgi:hypothetical protein